MSPLLLAAIVFITLALIFYTTCVFGERRSGTLTARHVVIFWLVWLIPYVIGMVIGMG